MSALSVENDLVYRGDSGEVFTTSVLIAQHFQKRHKSIIRKIESLAETTFSRLKIAPRNYIDDRGKLQKMYLLNRDAYSFIAMSFVGKKFDQWKLDYIDAFNRLEKIAKRQLQKQINESWQKVRNETKSNFKTMNAILDGTRKIDGKETKFFHYMCESKLINFALIGNFKSLDRASLDETQLKVLAELEAKNTVLLARSLSYDKRKAILRAFALEQLAKLAPCPIPTHIEHHDHT